MARRFACRFQGTVFLIALLGSLNARSPSEAREIEVDRLPCNELCQAWLGLDTKRGITGSTAVDSRPKTKVSIHKLKMAVPDQTSRVRQTRLASTKAEPAASIDGSSVPKISKIPKAVVAPKHVRAATWGDETNVPLPVPLPVPRPATANALPDAAIGASVSATSGSQDPALKPVGAAAARDTGAGSVAPIGQVSPSAPDRHAGSETRVARTEPSQAEHPPLVAMMPSPLSRKPRAAATTPIDDASKVPVDATANQPMPSSVADAGEPGAEDASKPGSKEPRPPHLLASLSPPVDVQTSIQDRDRPGGGSRIGSLQPLTELTGGPSPVTIGQISSELHGTDVHVVVVNVLLHEMKDVDVLCRVLDVRGVQVAESSAHIASIAPSDVAFGQVIFHSEIPTRGNDFACQIGRIVTSTDTTP